jgi:hypothetical protein
MLYICTQSLAHPHSEFGKEVSVNLAGLDEASINGKLEELVRTPQ